MSSATRIVDLPPSVAKTILGGTMCEFATVTAKGVPLNTPMLYSVEPDATTVDVSTGVSYPTKAERARRNPKVGLLIEAPDGGPVVSISAWAGVRDADIQANALRYANDFRSLLPMIGGGRSWEAMRGAYWYWARIFIHCAPETIRWWPTAEATTTTGAEEVWCAPSGGTPLASDPPPTRPPSAAPSWREPGDWRARAEEVISTFPPPHLSVIDTRGFPLPFRTTSVRVTADGFCIDIPGGAPWPAQGAASLCFSGRATFVGQLDGGDFVVDRMLPELPMVADMNEIFDPTPPVRATLVERLGIELERRGQAVPEMPTTPPWAS
jgi:hypothetical protein